jgi:hypothetical protein
MNDTERKQLQLSILLLLLAAGEVGMTEGGMLPQLRLDYRELTAPQLATELRGLADKKWTLKHQPSIGMERWKLISLGTAALQEVGLA